MNSQLVHLATSARNKGYLASLISQGHSDTQIVRALYDRTLSRKPTAKEAEHFAKYVEDGGAAKDKKKALGDVFWALLNSSEFMLNH